MAGKKVCYGLLGAALIVLAAYLVAGAVGAFVALGLVTVLGVQFWLVSTGDGDVLDTHVVRGPPDGG